MNTPTDELTTNSVDLTVELRFANGATAEFHQTNSQRIRETLRLLAEPQLFAQHHLSLVSLHEASMIPCKGIDMILVRTFARAPLKFPLDLPVGRFDLVEQPEAWADQTPVAREDADGQPGGQPRRRDLRVEIHTLGGWAVTLKAVAMIRGHLQDERHLFSRLPEVPTIPFRLEGGGFGLINTTNILQARGRPKPEALPGKALPLEFRRWTPAHDPGLARREEGMEP